MLTVRNLRPQPTKLEWLRVNASSIAALFLWACAMVMLAEVGQPDGEQEYSVTSAEGAMFFSRTSGEFTCEADPEKASHAINRIGCSEEPPSNAQHAGNGTHHRALPVEFRLAKVAQFRKQQAGPETSEKQAAP